MDVFAEAEIISLKTSSYFVGVAYSYQKNGLSGLIKYQLSQPDILEHKIPQLISLFDSIYSFVAEIHGKDCNDFSLSSVSRYYETGVKSPLGEYLVEFGYPTDTIRAIERKIPGLMNIPKSKARVFCRGYSNEIENLVDDYEWDLFIAAMKSLPE